MRVWVLMRMWREPLLLLLLRVRMRLVRSMMRRRRGLLELRVVLRVRGMRGVRRMRWVRRVRGVVRERGHARGDRALVHHA